MLRPIWPSNSFLTFLGFKRRIAFASPPHNDRLDLESRMCMNTNMKKSKSGHMSTRSALSDCLFEIFLYFWTSDLQYFLESDLYFIQICIFWFVTNRFKIWSLCDVSCHIALECLFDKHMAHLHYSFKLVMRCYHLFGHQMTPLARVAKLATW